ncbi:MAG TPA: alkaline phosphatase [Hyphomicrobium sp.]|nr:alkaline phosphatase [Hyphomicrobium sp.]
MKNAIGWACFGLLLTAVAMPAVAQTIYPINRAQILTGANFDLKVEFAGTPAPADIKVTINGEDAAKALGKAPEIIANEDGFPQTAYWIRGAHLDTAGTFTVEASAGSARASVAWDVFATPAGRKARNVILFIGDGMSIAHRTAARILSKGIAEGRYGGELAIDDMPYMALVSTAGTDSVITDSANSMTAYTTGHKSCVNALGVYCAKNFRALAHPRVETIAELAKRKLGLAVGVVTNTEIEDATPAGMVAHTRLRSDYEDIVRMFYAVQPDVIMGGGAAPFLPKRWDPVSYIDKFKEAGYAFAANATELKAEAAKPETRKLLGLFNDGNMDGALDRKFLKKGTVSKFPDQPDLTEEVRTALQMLSRNDKGFVLMVESGLIDKYSHSLDWERAVYDTIMLDDAVQVAKDFAASRDDTLIIVVPDHGHPISLVGTYDDEAGSTLREKLQTYAAAQFPNYAPADREGYPPSVDVSRRLALVFAAYPDYCDAGKPNLPGPAELGKVPKLPKEEYCAPGSGLRVGNLPLTARAGVHSGDDVVLTATGPGAEVFHGHIDNTMVFRAMATALGLGN